MVWSSSFRSLALNQAPWPESSLLVFLMVNTMVVPSLAPSSASLESSRSPFGQPLLLSHFSSLMPGVRSGVRVHTMLLVRSLPFTCSVNTFSWRSVTFTRVTCT